MKKNKNIPKFASEDEERKFWEENDSSEFIDWDQAEKLTFANLKPTTKTISLRLPGSLLNKLKVLAHKSDVPYQSLIKMFLNERVNKELKQG